MPFFIRIMKVLENASSADVRVKVTRFLRLQTQASHKLVKCKGLKKILINCYSRTLFL
jgi:hypothetical protein